MASSPWLKEFVRKRQSVRDIYGGGKTIKDPTIWCGIGAEGPREM